MGNSMCIIYCLRALHRRLTGPLGKPSEATLQWQEENVYLSENVEVLASPM